MDVECLVADDDEAFTYNKRVSEYRLIEENCESGRLTQLTAFNVHSAFWSTALVPLIGTIEGSGFCGFLLFLSSAISSSRLVIRLSRFEMRSVKK